MIDAEDAEEWDGRGDLMVREWRRLHLHIEQPLGMLSRALVFAEIGDEPICDRGKMLQPSMLWDVGLCLRRLSLSSFLFILSGCSTISAP